MLTWVVGGGEVGEAASRRDSWLGDAETQKMQERTAGKCGEHMETSAHHYDESGEVFRNGCPAVVIMKLESSCRDEKGK